MQRYPLIQKALVIDIILFLLIPCMIPSFGQNVTENTYQSTSEGNILYVGGSGEGNYTKIQDAINDSNTGDTIYVYDESSPYYEHLVIQKSVSLIGEDRFSTEINGSLLENSLDTVNITGDHVVINGFRISYNPGYYYQAGVKVIGKYLTLSDCIIHDNEWIGISLLGASFCQILDCELYGNLIAINLVNSKNNRIQNCMCHKNSDAITLYQASDNNQLIDCTCMRNSFNSIHIQQSSGNQITGCVVQDGYDGISLACAPNTKMRNNTISDNYANFGIGSSSVLDFYCDIDTSNTINGKPMYYLIGQSNLLFDETMEIGFLGLVNCFNISVKNCDFVNNFEGMAIVGTSQSFIENCSFSNNEGHGMYLISSQENKVRNCTFRNGFFDGIFLYNSSNNTVETCLIYDSSAGLRLEYSTDNTLLQQKIDQCMIGILFDISSNNTLIGNTMFHCGLQVTGNRPGDYINDVDTTNLVNDKSVYYYVNEHNQTIPQNAGEVILVNSSGCSIKNLHIEKGTVGITLAYSSKNLIAGNTIKDQSWTGIDLSSGYSDNNTIQKNIIQRSGYGIDIEYCTDTTLKYNIIDSNVYGVLSYNAVDTIIRRNTFVRNSLGINAVQTTQSTIRWNNIFQNTIYGLSVDGCSVSAPLNWWGSTTAPAVDSNGNGDHLNAIREGQISFIPWHRFPVLFSGILRYILTNIQQKNSMGRQFTILEKTSFELSQRSSVDFTVHGMKNIRITLKQTERPEMHLE